MSSPKFVRDSGVGGARSRNYWCGTVGTTWWFYFTGPSTNEVWSAYVEHCRAMLESKTERPSLVCVCHHADSPTAEQRRMIAEFIEAESKRLSSLVGFALVLDSPLHVLALRAINWIVKKPFPETVCGSPSTAAMWLDERGARIDPYTLASAFEAQVPREHLSMI